MKLLVDTHVALWFFDDPELLSRGAREAIEDPGNVVYLSAASVWEWSVKRARGRGSMPREIVEWAEHAGFVELHVTWVHGREATGLPGIHGDPFDRMLVAQAVTENLVLVTRDRAMLEYDVATIAA